MTPTLGFSYLEKGLIRRQTSLCVTVPKFQPRQLTVSWRGCGQDGRVKAPRFLIAVRYIFFFETFNLVLDPTQSPIQREPTALSPGLGDRAFKLITHQGILPRLKHEWSYTFSSPIHLHFLHRNNFTTVLYPRNSSFTNHTYDSTLSALNNLNKWERYLIESK